MAKTKTNGVIRVAVVSTDFNSDITESSPMEEVLKSEDTKIYTIDDFFKALNNDRLGSHHAFMYNTITLQGFYFQQD